MTTARRPFSGSSRRSPRISLLLAERQAVLQGDGCYAQVHQPDIESEGTELFKAQNGWFRERQHGKASPERQQASHEHLISEGDLLVLAGASDSRLKTLHLLLDGDGGDGDVGHGV